ncbi:MAG: aspartate kinase, partial [Armatimonadetes bacterium]|nr:aspartate kinase [Armatimonadota bacterium]
MRVVQKYGGSSVAAVRLMRGVAARIAKTRHDTPGDVVVVVSAMGDDTDGLKDLARRASPKPRPRELDLLLATGEQKAVALMALSLQARGVPAVA